MKAYSTQECSFDIMLVWSSKALSQLAARTTPELSIEQTVGTNETFCQLLDENYDNRD
jgi:hypothetical protein